MSKWEGVSRQALASASLRVRLYDYDNMISSDSLGEVVMPLEQFVSEDRSGFNGWRPLAACDKLSVPKHSQFQTVDLFEAKGANGIDDER